jgi:hypothetical protein
VPVHTGGGIPGSSIDYELRHTTRIDSLIVEVRAMADKDLAVTFQALKALLQPLEPSLVKVHDQTDNYYLDTAYIQKNKKPLYFGSVRTGRNHVSFHLMPVYLWPELLDGISDRLKKRMQGKSCFNFKAADPDLLDELGALTNQGFTMYRNAGYVP